MSHDHDRPHPLRSLAVLAIGALGFALAQTTLIPTLTELRDELGTDTSGVAWVLTGYLLAAAVSTPIAGRLGDMFGKRRLFVLSLLVFGAGNVVSALGTSIEVVVAGRVLQGIGGGIIPLAISIIRDEFPPEKVPGSIGLISAIFGIGGGLGLVLGGVITDALSYHWIFWLGAIVAVVAAAAAELFVPESPVRTRGRVDFRGAALLAAGLVPPLVRRLARERVGVGHRAHVGSHRRRRRASRRVGRRGAADRRAARRRPIPGRPAGADDQHHHGARSASACSVPSS